MRANAINTADDTPKIASRAVPCLLRWVERRRSQSRSPLPEPALPSGIRDAPDEPIAVSKYVGMWQAIASVEPTIGLLLPTEVDEDDLHLITYIMRRSATLRDSLLSGMRYAPLVSEAYRTLFWEDRDVAGFDFLPGEPAWEIPPVMEYHLATLVRMLADETDGKFCPSVVTFAYSDPGYGDRYRAVFGVQPDFDAPRTSIRFPRTMLALPMRSHAPHIHPILRDHADALLRQQDRAKTTSERAGEALVSRLDAGSEVRLIDVAGDLAIPSGRLQRILRSEGTSWRSLLDQTRRQLASRRLANGDRVVDLAPMLGYSEPAALHHAIQRWFGSDAARIRRRRT